MGQLTLLKVTIDRRGPLLPFGHILVKSCDQRMQFEERLIPLQSTPMHSLNKVDRFQIQKMPLLTTFEERTTLTICAAKNERKVTQHQYAGFAGQSLVKLKWLMICFLDDDDELSPIPIC